MENEKDKSIRKTSANINATYLPSRIASLMTLSYSSVKVNVTEQSHVNKSSTEI